ncbi:bile acid:sodium symporter family protein [Corynebacterium uberis]|uniref:bile acid:sodium symporter family protein n=1 Tax=Corynebacterium TaxID=1716 RepID=UPI001D0B7D04|nr:bile acid:sodium symporter family protein [Corynebacterium uberis]MCZ9310172.1 bile acid:sodium symporter [Corynebacterium sp. c6VSa_13]UDL75812.1 bile acid:sodium symporter [Corynebacterium uberis]UDL78025.1 bile acid:sodium symporter [Corynebacterium uberis]UDL80307.1 bile acid:sodium symporter [Corynebacterium uberis]UDL84649.1 bile acid:sodium symporter [Corynebacterium uberis]
MTVLRRLDPLIVLILSAVILAIIAPASGSFAHWFSWATTFAIAALFFLQGARLSPREALEGLSNWKLHLLILAFTFLVFPIIGVALRPLSAVTSPELYQGVLYLTLVPSTVQSSIAFTSIARGNVAGAIVAASLSNLVGVVLTPLLVMALMGGSGGLHIDASVFLDVALQLFFPFMLGQLLRPWVKNFAARKATSIVDRGSITMVVYSAFSGSVVAGIWSDTQVTDILIVVALSIVLVAFMLWLTRTVARRLGFPRKDIIAIEFCGTKKSLSSAVPMASIMFGGAQLGLLIVPIMIFHQVQLMMCSWLASRYAQADGARG